MWNNKKKKKHTHLHKISTRFFWYLLSFTFCQGLFRGSVSQQREERRTVGHPELPPGLHCQMAWSESCQGRSQNLDTRMHLGFSFSWWAAMHDEMSVVHFKICAETLMQERKGSISLMDIVYWIYWWTQKKLKKL